MLDATKTGGQAPAERSSLRTRLTVLGVATGIGLLESAKSYFANRIDGTPVDVGWAVMENLPWWYLWLALMPVILAVARRFPFDRHHWWLAAPVHLVASFACAAVHLSAFSVLHWEVLSQGLFDASLGAQTARFFTSYFFSDWLTYWLILAVEHALMAQRRLREREVEAARLETRAARLESGLASAHLEKLRAELNPHFLFNTLNAIAGLVRRRELDGAVQMLARLGELLRASLERQTDQTVSLEVELGLLQRYLNVEEVRFRDRLSIAREIDPAVMGAQVPTLILQPLVENAILHGVARRPGPGTVRLAARRADGDLVIRVENTGAVRHGGATRMGIGLSNTRARLFELYREAGRLQFDTKPDGTAVATVTLPLSFVPAEVSHAPG